MEAMLITAPLPLATMAGRSWWGFVIALAFLPPTNLVAEVGGRGDIDGDHILCNGNQAQVD